MLAALLAFAIAGLAIHGYRLQQALAVCQGQNANAPTRNLWHQNGLQNSTIYLILLDTYGGIVASYQQVVLALSCRHATLFSTLRGSCEGVSFAFGNLFFDELPQLFDVKYLKPLAPQFAKL
jgi:hypothetical protein